MARARNIKPAFFMNETLVSLSFEVRLLFIGLWTLADREGRLEDRPKRIKMELFPADDLDVDAALLALEQSDLIERYEVGGVKVVWVKNFKKHQSPHHTEKDSVLPAKNEMCSQGRDDAAQRSQAFGAFDFGALDKKTVSSRECDGENRSDLLNPDSLIPDSLIPDLPISSSNGSTKVKKHKGEIDAEKKIGVQEEAIQGGEAKPEEKKNKNGEVIPPPSGSCFDVGKSRQKRKRQAQQSLPEDFALTAQDEAFAHERGVDAVYEFAAFRSYHQAKGSMMLDWHAAWRTWCLNSLKFTKQRVEKLPDKEGNGVTRAKQNENLTEKRREKLSEKDYKKGVRADGTVAF